MRIIVMQSMLNLWSAVFWMVWLLFFVSTTNVIKLFIVSEIIWLVLYVYAVIVGIYSDDIYMFTLPILILAVASVEFSIGFIFIIFFKKIFKSTSLMESTRSDWVITELLNKK